MTVVTARYPVDPGHVVSTFVGRDVPLALHSWGPPDHVRPTVFYVHGLQSHAGWLSETGTELARRGVGLLSADRRGSGRSKGPRGDVPDVDTLLDDYAQVLAHWAQEVRGRLTVLGQSFGASVLAALVARGQVPAAARVVLCAPALGQQRARNGPDALQQARSNRDTLPTPVRLKDEDYTGEPGYLRMMANDLDMVRAVTGRFRAAMVGVEDAYIEAGAPPWADREVFVAVPEDDTIIDTVAALDLVRVIAPQARVHRFASHHHYLEFSPARQAYWDWLANVARGELP